MPYALALDLGSTSIGHAAFQIDEKGNRLKILHAGVRMYPTGKEQNGASLAAERRAKRQMRRMRDRKIRRGKAIIRTLIEWNMMPADKAAQQQLLRDLDGAGKGNDKRPPSDPFNLRARALHEQLPPMYTGRALYHIHKHRGFKSNRKTDRAADDVGVVLGGIKNLTERMKETSSATLGEFLAHMKNSGKHARRRSGIPNDMETIFPAREMLEKEFWAIWNKQADYYPEMMTKERGEHLFRIIFHQRDLKKQEPGKCSYLPSENRIAKADPLFQHFRLLKELNELQVIESGKAARPLTLNERDMLLGELSSKKTMSFKAMRKLLKLSDSSTFNKESERREGLTGNETAAIMANKKLADASWLKLSMSDQRQIIESITEEEDLGKLHSLLQSYFDLSEEQIISMSNVTLPSGYASIGPTAAQKISVEMQNAVVTEYGAAEAAGLHGKDTAKVYDILPPYQEILSKSLVGGSGSPDDSYDAQYGRIANPTVHIGLNQLRKLINLYIRKYGKPAEISVEIARDLAMSPKRKTEYESLLKKNTLNRTKIKDRLSAHGITPTSNFIELVKIWQEMPTIEGYDKDTARMCVYTGVALTFDMVVNGDVEIDHILPFSISLDDSANNKVVCLKSANQMKGPRAPADVSQWRDSYSDILKRARHLNLSRYKRFSPLALDEYKQENKFLARHLVDTQYLSKAARVYLACLFSNEDDAENGHPLSKVKAVPGRITAVMRRAWGFNSLIGNDDEKDRQDLRHHAIDAVTVGLVTPSLIQQISKIAKSGDSTANRHSLAAIFREVQPPEYLVNDLKRHLDRMVISHKQDRGTINRERGQTSSGLHNETAYGPVLDENGDMTGNVVRSIPLFALKAENISKIRDKELRAKIEQIFYEIDKTLPEKAFKAAFDKSLSEFQKTSNHFTGIRSVRIEETLKTIPIRDEQGRIFKSYKGDSNDFTDVWKLSNGTIKLSIISTFQAHTEDETDHSAAIRSLDAKAKKIARLYKNDMVAYEENNVTKYGRVAKSSKNGIAINPHNRSGTDGYITFTAKKISETNFRPIAVDEIGYVYDSKNPKNNVTKKA